MNSAALITSVGNNRRADDFYLNLSYFFYSLIILSKELYALSKSNFNFNIAHKTKFKILNAKITSPKNFKGYPSKVGVLMSHTQGWVAGSSPSHSGHPCV